MSVNRQNRSATIGKIERRTVKSQVRASKADGKSKIAGYAAVFGQITDLGWFKEEILPGAFKRSISEGADVRCLFNHDANYILGRTKSKTLTISEDDKGLTYECDAPATAHAESVVAAIERGDVDGSSFGFIAMKQEWIEDTAKDGSVITTRRILDAEIFDVSPVVFPAYEGTSCDIRSLWPEGAPAEVRARLKKTKRNEDCECDCQECQDGDCANCSNPDCEDPNCEGHEGRNKKRKLRAKKSGKKRRAADTGDDDDQPLINALSNGAESASDFAMSAAAALSEVENDDDEDAGPALEEALSDAKKLKGLLDDFIAEAEKELAEDKGDDEEGMREKARVTAAVIRATL